MLQIPIVKKKLQSLVGFYNLANQVHRKSIKQGFHFTLMVVGESGLGKSTLINTIFHTNINTPLDHQKENADPSAPHNSSSHKSIEIQTTSTEIDENGVKLKLTVIETPGFGDFVNNEEAYRPILDNIQSRFDMYLEQENRVNRRNRIDTRVHACLYFITPTGHSLKPLDIEFMKKLGNMVNLIPVIAKADTLTEAEVNKFKARILEDIKANDIHVYYPPTVDEHEDPETLAENKEIITRIPFAVVGSNTEIDMPNGKKLRGRKYPWGLIDVDNETHCDTAKLRQMLIRTHMEELKEHTNEVLYETYRSHKLSGPGGASILEGTRGLPMGRFEEEKAAHEAKMRKMENEMRVVFQQKVAEKEAKLKQSEQELYARHREMKEQLEKQRLELEEKKRRLLSGGGTPDRSAKTKPKAGAFFSKQ
ncbi:hypothetical protein HDV05_002829 [Chytridiales sp. JEL 0842]|nr:hypothetical protein HDV05_002829 [Chytridiales sp. JEL 0842]